jgi:hypothetical protein
VAIYHFSAKMIKRSEGQSATAHAAYCAHEKIKDFRTGEVHDYRRRNLRDEISFAEIIAPDNAPEFCSDRAQLWSEVEQAEKRKDAQVARSITVALPRELSDEQNQQLARSFCKDTFASEGMVADCCIHDIESDNPHAHIILTTRELKPDGFGKKNRDWNDKKTLEQWRKNWSEYANSALKSAQIDERIDHRSYEDQGVNLVAGIHLGKTVSEMERRGERTPRGDIYRLVKQRNEHVRKAAACKLERPARVFDEHNTDFANIESLLEYEATPAESIQLINAQLKAENTDFNAVAESAFNKTAESRLQHTIDLSLHRTKRRIVKCSSRKLIKESQKLSERLSSESDAKLTVEKKVAKMSVFGRVKAKIAQAGRDIADIIKKPFVSAEPEPEKAPESSLLNGRRATQKQERQPEHQNQTLDAPTRGR